MVDRDKQNRDEDAHIDPPESDLEIDAANDSMGGPTTENHNAGLSSSIEPAGATGDASTGNDKNGGG